MEKLYEYLPHELVTFVLVTLFSLLIGLSIRRLSLKREGETTLSGPTERLLSSECWVICFIFSTLWRCTCFGWRVDLGHLARDKLLRQTIEFSCLWGNYHYHCTDYLLPCPHCEHPAIVVLRDGGGNGTPFTEMKHTFTELVQRMQNDEMITLAKFLAISGIILPMLPNENFFPEST